MIIADVEAAHIELKAAKWVREKFGNWHRPKKFNQSQIESAFLAGFAAGLEHGANQMKVTIDASLRNQPADNDT